MTLSLKSLNSAIEAVQAEVKATDELSAKLAETIARIEEAERKIHEIRTRGLEIDHSLELLHGDTGYQDLAERVHKAEKRLDIQAGWNAELFNRTGAMVQQIDILEKRDALAEAAKAVKDKAKAVWKAAMA